MDAPPAATPEFPAHLARGPNSPGKTDGLDLSIIVVNYESWPDTVCLVHGLLRSAGIIPDGASLHPARQPVALSLEVLVVDNNSRDRTVAVAEAFCAVAGRRGVSIGILPAVADPAKGSKHNRGSAVDLTLYDLRTGEPAVMPSLYDEFGPRASPDYAGGTAEQRRRRGLLRTGMEAQGFTVNPGEWWHFDYRDWEQYPILNVPFERLGARQ